MMSIENLKAATWVHSCGRWTRIFEGNELPSSWVNECSHSVVTAPMETP